ncbi:MAG: carbohydrate kinase [Alphaproteobacteria bacterium]|nr:carbohydrate kinase [Alphaproteobacteria bacterium]
MRPLIFGEVLFDQFPDGSVVLGGAPFNVAWHLHAFGLRPLMVSRVGADDLGQRVMRAMTEWGMDTAGMQTDPEHPTGTVEIEFDGGEPRYDIVHPAAYDFIDAEGLPQLDGETWLFYHGSLAARQDVSAATLAHLRARAATRFVDINLRAPWWDRDALDGLLSGADWVKLNADELEVLFPGEDGEAARLARLAATTTDRIILTRGADGAAAISAASGNRVEMRPERSAAVVDTVGAGDAFCSVMLAGRILNWPLDTSLRRAQDFASAVVGIRGALSRDTGFYADFLRAWNVGG